MTPAPISRSRAWLLFALLCAAGIFNAMDRPIIAILKPDMSAEFGWTDADFGRLAAVTQFAAALSFLFTGWLIDRLGVRRSMVAGVTAWSLAAVAHGWAMTGWQVVAARIGLGATEAVQTPLTIKTVAILFGPKLRSLAIGAGTLIGAAGTIALPFFIPLLAATWGWRGALIFAGAGGFLILGLWWIAARGIVFDDRAEARSAEDTEGTAPYGPILLERRTWAIVVAKALSDATWWLLNFWLPDFYRRELGLSTEQLGIPLAIAFLGSGLGALLAGWVSDRLLAAGWPAQRVRRTVMLVCALLVTPVPLVLHLGNFWAVTIMIGVVLAGHQGFSLSIFGTITDMVPPAKVARVTAFGAFCGNMGGVAIVWITGLVLAAGGGYLPLFLFAAASYLLGFAWIRTVMPKPTPKA
ncbi:MFS transporter [Sphingomonas sp. PL-96]|uniref:MFS transporter n=1 Tax=Sphingomonas sp. PL-96 TaxID=2887201 RepID=UPI001E4885B8|nr:MFS transporter [Sphingomonas sp. PL-96]MCC2975174.1 MFS transporter [Sphingomonas sp. PL-96]